MKHTTLTAKVQTHYDVTFAFPEGSIESHKELLLADMTWQGYMLTDKGLREFEEVAGELSGLDPEDEEVYLEMLKYTHIIDCTEHDTESCIVQETARGLTNEQT